MKGIKKNPAMTSLVSVILSTTVYDLVGRPGNDVKCF